MGRRDGSRSRTGNGSNWKERLGKGGGRVRDVPSTRPMAKTFSRPWRRSWQTQLARSPRGGTVGLDVRLYGSEVEDYFVGSRAKEGEEDITAEALGAIGAEKAEGRIWEPREDEALGGSSSSNDPGVGNGGGSVGASVGLGSLEADCVLSSGRADG